MFCQLNSKKYQVAENYLPVRFLQLIGNFWFIVCEDK